MTRLPDALHATHDLELVASYASGDATGADLDAATALVARCPECAVLHHDLRAIAAALPSAAVPMRTRDFRLTPEQAASLRPRGWRRFIAAFAGPGFRFAAPLGTGLATLGIAGLLLGTLTSSPLLGATTTAGLEQSKADFSAAAPMPAASAAPSALALTSAAPSVAMAPADSSVPPPVDNGTNPVPSVGSGGGSSGSSGSGTGSGVAGTGGQPGDTTATMQPPAASPETAYSNGGGPVPSDGRALATVDQIPASPTKGTEDAPDTSSPFGVLLPFGALALLVGLGMLALRLGSRRLA